MKLDLLELALRVLLYPVVQSTHTEVGVVEEGGFVILQGSSNAKFLWEKMGSAFSGEP